jgi:hypothetical protein
MMNVIPLHEETALDTSSALRACCDENACKRDGFVRCMLYISA